MGDSKKIFNRRDFIKGAGYAAVGAAIGLPAVDLVQAAVLGNGNHAVALGNYDDQRI